MARRTQINLDRKQLVTAAFDLMQEVGLDALSMRALAARIGVQAPALYWHVSDKAELLGLMAADIHAQTRAAVADAADWRDWLRAFGHSFRRQLLQRRDAAKLCSIAKPDMTRTEEAAQEISAPLMVRGLSQHDALSFQASVIALTLGWSVYQNSGPMADFLATMMDFDQSYATGLDALVRGFEASS